jgi:type III secretion system (T3SS) inner membrane Yop/YscD-like protein
VSFALTIREGNGRGQRFRFAGDRVSIGRGAENDVVLNDAGVSRAHARIERRGAIWVLLDRGSANGTQLNGAPLAAMAQLQEADRIRVGTVTFEFRDLDEGSGSGAGRSRLWAAAWWGRQRPPARAGWIAGCALVAVAGSGTASWRFEPPSTGTPRREETAPREDQPWPTGKMGLRTDLSAPGAVAAARAAYDLGRRKLEERRIAPRNLYDAWKAFREGRAHLDGLADPAPLRAELGRLIEECERELERQCGRLLFRATRFERYGQEDRAQGAWREVLLHFPGDDATGCRRKARDHLASAQPDDGVE